MRFRCVCLMVAAISIASCSGSPSRRTLAELRTIEADVEEIQIQDSLERAVESYRRYLEETPRGVLTPEAMRRVADLQIERHYGIMGDAEIRELPAPPDYALMQAVEESRNQVSPAAIADSSESGAEFEQRTTGQFQFGSFEGELDGVLPDYSADPALEGPVEAIAIYQRILEEYPSYEHNDQVLYQMARAHDELGQTEQAMAVMERFVAEYSHSRLLDEVLFRRAEYFFTRKRYVDAEDAYSAIISMGTGSSYYELALYKLGWSLYKQELYEEALNYYAALLNYKLSIGYDFNQSYEEDDDRRVADTFRVISLSFSNLGGPDVLEDYFSGYGNRSYENRIYSNLAAFYLSKLRYNDAAEVYESFVDLYAFHEISPHFSMRITEVYAEGGFPLLVVDSKRDFATDYGLQAEYWNYFDVNDSSEVLSYLKTNLQDLASHYHALYQEEALAEEKPENYREALLWYREFLASFSQDTESPVINYQLANLLLENEDFGAAASEYERTAYNYATHDQASAAGYAAIYAHREHLKRASEASRMEVQLATIASSLRFLDTFPEHGHAPVVLSAAAEDLYEIKDFELAIASANKLIERYPAADLPLRHSAWTVVAHSSFDVEAYADAELAYMTVLELTPADDATHQAFVDTLAASIYMQGEQANAMQDYRAAADHFLRIKEVAPTSDIRAAAEYDAAAALVRLEDWLAAAEVFEAFRDTYPENELIQETTRQLAFVYRQAGQLDRSAGEYDRIAAETSDPGLRRAAMLEAGELYEEAESMHNALDVYVRYIDEFPEPLDIAQETRFKVADIYEANGDRGLYFDELREIVAVDKAARAGRTDRSRFLAAQSALVLSEPLFDDFVAVKLVQPFEQSLAEKRAQMATAMNAFEELVSYEVGEVTAAATYYIAEVYYDFSQSLLNSELPTDLSPAELTDYEFVLEEESFPFEEQAIDVHEANFELLAAGLYNRWIQRSLDRLAIMMPGRYAKSELGSGFIESIDTYAYRAPNASEIGIDGEPTDEDSQREDPTVPSDESSGQSDLQIEDRTEQWAQGLSNVRLE